MLNNTTRRTFLAGASPAFLSSGASPNSRLRAAVVGCRGRGWDLMQCVHELSGPENIELAAMCEVDESVMSDRLKRFEKLGGKRPLTFVDIRKLLEDKSIDVVFH